MEVSILFSIQVLCNSWKSCTRRTQMAKRYPFMLNSSQLVLCECSANKNFLVPNRTPIQPHQASHHPYHQPPMLSLDTRLRHFLTAPLSSSWSCLLWLLGCSLGVEVRDSSGGSSSNSAHGSTESWPRTI